MHRTIPSYSTIGARPNSSSHERIARGPTSRGVQRTRGRGQALFTTRNVTSGTSVSSTVGSRSSHGRYFPQKTWRRGSREVKAHRRAGRRVETELRGHRLERLLLEVSWRAAKDTIQGSSYAAQALGEPGPLVGDAPTRKECLSRSGRRRAAHPSESDGRRPQALRPATIPRRARSAPTTKIPVAR
jgi:hypothetical protein